MFKVYIQWNRIFQLDQIDKTSMVEGNSMPIVCGKSPLDTLNGLLIYESLWNIKSSQWMESSENVRYILAQGAQMTARPKQKRSCFQGGIIRDATAKQWYRKNCPTSYQHCWGEASDVRFMRSHDSLTYHSWRSKREILSFLTTWRSLDSLCIAGHVALPIPL